MCRRKGREIEEKTRGIAFIHSHSQHICMAYILIFCQGLHILISIKRKMQNHNLMQMKARFNEYLTRLYNLHAVHTASA